MFKYFNNKWIVILLILSFIIIFLNITKGLHAPYKYEGFSQSLPFLLKTNNDIYDSYYAEVYDDLYKPQLRTDFEYKTIIDMTQPSKTNSVFLDIGSGTGNLVNTLTENGYQAYGIDQSEAMVEIAKRKYPKTEFKCGFVEDPMVFNSNTFTHITCMNFTIYHMKDKITFIRNCYQWLVGNGYLVIHLVEKNKFNPIVPAAVPVLLDNPQKYSNTRITDSAVDFGGFQYKNTQEFKKDSCEVVVKETFTDAKTNNIRQNEITLHMDDLKNIVYMIQKCGFTVKGMMQMKEDEYQYIYIFEKVLSFV